MQGRNEVNFEVLDEDGVRHQARKIREPVPGVQLVGGGSGPTRTRFELDDGTELEPMVGAQQFVAAGRRFRRA